MPGNEIVLIFIVSMVLFAILIRPLFQKGKGIQSFVLHMITGLVLLVVFNRAGESIGLLYLPINFATVVISAFMGLPGVLLLIVLKTILFS